MSKKPSFKAYDVADYINSPEDVVAYLDAAFEDGDPAVIAAMIGAVARSKGMSAIAEQTGRSRESLYRALSAEGNPTPLWSRCSRRSGCD